MMALHARAERNRVSVEEEVQRRIAALPTGCRNQMAAFLASVDAGNITGQAYNVDGGAVMVALGDQGGTESLVHNQAE
jgi:hypothetical protein